MKEKVLRLLKSPNDLDIAIAFELMRTKMSIRSLRSIIDKDGITNGNENHYPKMFFRISKKNCIAYGDGNGTWISSLAFENFTQYNNLGNHPEYDKKIKNRSSNSIR